MTGNKRLRVLFVTPWYPYPEIPFGGVFVREHARAVQLYHDVIVLHGLGGTAQLPKYYQLEKDRFNEDPALSPQEQIPTYVMRYRKSTIPGLDRIRRHWAVQRALRDIVQAQFKPDIIHAHIHRMALPSFLFGYRNKIPLVITEHHSAFPLKSLSSADILEARLAFKRAQTVMPVSKALQNSIKSHKIQANFKIVPNVVDTQLFAPANLNSTTKFQDSNAIRLLCVAGMPVTHVKGYPYLFDALAGMETQHDWHLDIIGNGPMMDEYVERVSELNLSDRITFHGYQNKSEIVAAMQRANIFVLASIWDNMPCVLVEAMAMGLPIVATRIGGIPEVITDDYGLLAEPANSLSLGGALLKMMDTYTEYSPAKSVETARQKYSYRAVGYQLSEIYEEAIAKSR